MMIEGVLWIVFNRDGTPYFTTVYPLDREPQWQNGGYHVKRISYKMVDGQVKIEVTE